MALKTSYNKKVPPIITVNASSFSPVVVKVSTVLLKVVAIVEIENKIDFQFTIVMQWKENRAKFNNLKQDTSLNALTDEEIYSLWLPKIIYDNTDQKEMTRLSSRQADAQWVRSVARFLELYMIARYSIFQHYHCVSRGGLHAKRSRRG